LLLCHQAIQHVDLVERPSVVAFSPINAQHPPRDIEVRAGLHQEAVAVAAAEDDTVPGRLRRLQRVHANLWVVLRVEHEVEREERAARVERGRGVGAAAAELVRRGAEGGRERGEVGFVQGREQVRRQAGAQGRERVWQVRRRRARAEDECGELGVERGDLGRRARRRRGDGRERLLPRAQRARAGEAVRDLGDALPVGQGERGVQVGYRDLRDRRSGRDDESGRTRRRTSVPGAMGASTTTSMRGASRGARM
jgi:hypothetical protein